MPSTKVQTSQSGNLITSSAIITLIIGILTAKLLDLSISLDIFKYCDELLMSFIGLVFLRALLKLKADKKVIYLAFTLLYMISISLLSNTASFDKIILQSFIHLKFFIFYIIIDRVLTKSILNKIIIFLSIFTITGIITSLILGENLYSFSNTSPSYRNGILRIIGFQLSPNSLGITLGIFYLWIIFRYKNSRIKFIFWTTLLFTIIIYFTGSRVALVAIVLGCILYFLIQNKINKLSAIPFIAIIIIVFASMLSTTEIVSKTTKNISDISSNNDSGYIRGIMIYNSFKLAHKHFPFGTGAATYGTNLSEGSPVYWKLGLSNNRFFFDKVGIYDSNMASILGEFGFLGIIIILFFLRLIYLETKSNGNYFAIVIFCFLILSSLTTPILMNAYLALVFALFLVYSNKVNPNKLINCK